MAGPSKDEESDQDWVPISPVTNTIPFLGSLFVDLSWKMEEQTNEEQKYLQHTEELVLEYMLVPLAERKHNCMSKSDLQMYQQKLQYQDFLKWSLIMNGKEGSFRIKISSNDKDKPPETRNKLKVWVHNIWEFAKEDINRVTFSLKVGLAVLLVSLLILFQAPYQVFSTSIIWSILTVAIMFEYTVGATFHKGFNRVLGSLLAGVLAIAVAKLALMSGPLAEPILIGISIFVIGSITSFIKLWPTFAPYEYGFRVILFTYCLIIVSGYRSGNPIKTSIDRLYSIAIGAIVAIGVNTLIFPIWAGEQLHNELVKHFNSVADSLEECVNKYLNDDGSDHPEFSNTLMDEFPDEPKYKKCRSTLNSSAKLESLALSAKWEPPHGRFRHFFHPWSEYVKVGAVLRYCAYEVMALHGVLHSEIQAPYNLRSAFQREISEATSKAAELVRCLGKDICDMKQTLKCSLLKSVHSSTGRLQRAIETHAYLLASSYEFPDHSQLAEFNKTNAEGEINSQSQRMLHGNLPTIRSESCNEKIRRQSRRQYSWPSIEGDGNEDGTDGIPRTFSRESTAALSLSTFTSLLIEFVARLDHLVEAVHELSKMAKFEHDSL
ncbi:hypothetical protein L2E82_06463 [Cichorium intybus]|uniref:Uncharacterized protein n=1 Tax=Cichorium intybus TaxID=13427 RepID=A0ACB9HBB4_CICIN|nr:hypothetical protein L2E82_06463 [Cichorium intybus]